MHLAHDIYDVAPSRDGSGECSLQEITTADQAHIRCVGCYNRIRQTAHLGITVNRAMHIVLIEDDDALRRIDDRFVVVTTHQSQNRQQIDKKVFHYIV